MRLAPRGLWWTISILLVFAARTASSQESPLSLGQAVNVALERNPRVLAARQHVAAQAGLQRSARALPNPELLIVPFGTFNDNPLILNQTFDLFGKRTLRARAASSELSAAAAELKAVELSVAYDVTAAYLELLEAQRVRELTVESVNQAQTLHKLARQRFELGDVPQVHVTRTEIEVARLEQELERARGEVSVKQAMLNSAMGRDPAMPVAVAEQWNGTASVPYDLEPLKQRALTTRPEVLAAERWVEARKFNVQSARAQRNPDLAFQARTGNRTGSANGVRLGLGVSVPVFDWGGIGGQVRAAKAQVSEQEALLAQVKNEIVLQVETAFRRVQSARTVVDAYNQRITPKAEGLMKTLQLSYEQGGTTLIEILDAQRTLTATRIEQARAAASFHKAWAELERAIGGQVR